MRNIGLPDSHIHSGFSFDGEHSIGELCGRGAALGLRAVTITDHCEINSEGCFELWTPGLLEQSRVTARRFGEELRGRLEVYAGLELGQPMYYPSQARDILAHDYDFILASVHYLRDNRDFYYLNYLDGSSDPCEVYDKYLTELLDTAEHADYDSLAHMTYPLRYIVGRDQIDFDERPYQRRYDEILSAVAQRGKALELNVSGYRRKNGFPLPSLDILRRFKKLGGRYITLGTDTHRIADFGVGLDKGAKLVREAGFDSVAYYVHRRPIVVDIG